MEQIKSERIVNIPNALTLVRIALLPLVAWRFTRGDMRGAMLAYAAAMLTDAVDGVIARRFNQITALGKLLDPLADKLSLITLLGLFVWDGQIPVWLMMLILVKEALLVIGGGIALHRGIVVSALPIGKVTTVAFVASMLTRFFGLRRLADVLLGISVLLSLVALAWYSVVMAGKLWPRKSPSPK